jgi:hypothetical protein
MFELWVTFSSDLSVVRQRRKNDEGEGKKRVTQGHGRREEDRKDESMKDTAKKQTNS